MQPQAAYVSPALADLHTAPLLPLLWLQVVEWMCPAAGTRRVMEDPAIDTRSVKAAPGRRVMPAGTGISTSTQQGSEMESRTAVCNDRVLLIEDTASQGISSVAVNDALLKKP